MEVWQGKPVGNMQELKAGEQRPFLPGGPGKVHGHFPIHEPGRMDTSQISQPLGAKPGVATPMTAEVENLVDGIHGMVIAPLPGRNGTSGPASAVLLWR